MVNLAPKQMRLNSQLGVSMLRYADVNRRLTVPAFAWSELRVEVAPMTGPRVSVVTPGVSGPMLLGYHGCSQ